MWSNFVSKFDMAVSAVAFRFVDVFWSHAIAGVTLLASLFVITAVLSAELLERRTKVQAPQDGPALRLH